MTICVLKKYPYGLTPALAVCLVVFALAPSLAFAGDRLESFDFELYSGYRTDKFDWNIASDLTGGSTPNILSELAWDDLDIFQLGIESSLRISNNRLPFLGLITGCVNYGSISAGSNQDSDYDGNTRTLEFSRSNNDSSDGDVWDLSLAVGPEFAFYRQRFSFSPLLGYSYHEQNLTLTDGFQTISTPGRTPSLGFFPDLDSSYSAVWRGGWLGLNLTLNPGRSLALSGRIEWHLGEYLADADWNLRNELQHPVSFSHYADDARGLVVRLGADLSLTDRVFFMTEIAYMKWQAEDGIATIYLADNSINTTRLNEVNWESAGIVIGLTMLLN